MRKEALQEALARAIVDCHRGAETCQVKVLPADVAHAGGLRILLAEDNPVNQRVMQRLLQRGGHHVTTVGDGRAAVQTIARQPIDLVFMDVQMPEMDGFAATAAIRQLPPPYGNVPIVALTAHALKGDRERCIEAGMNSYLTKPIILTELHETLARFSRGTTDANDRTNAADDANLLLRSG